MDGFVEVDTSHCLDQDVKSRALLEGFLQGQCKFALAAVKASEELPVSEYLCPIMHFVKVQFP